MSEYKITAYFNIFKRIILDEKIVQRHSNSDDFEVSVR